MNNRLHLLPIAFVLLFSGCGAPSNQHTQISFDDALANVRQKIPADGYVTNEFLKQVAVGQTHCPRISRACPHRHAMDSE